MAKEPKTEPRPYIVVKRTGPIECEIHGTFTARTAGAAIDLARNGEAGRWAAIAASRWNEEELEVVQREPTVKRKRIEVVDGQLTTDDVLALT